MQVLLDVSTPAVAAPFLTDLFERAVGTGAVLLTADAKVCGSARAVLPGFHAMRCRGRRNYKGAEGLHAI